MKANLLFLLQYLLSKTKRILLIHCILKLVGSSSQNQTAVTGNNNTADNTDVESSGK